MKWRSDQHRRNHYRVRTAIASIALAVSVCVMIPPMVLAVLQVFVFDHAQFAHMMRALPMPAIAMPAIAGTIMVVATVIDVLKRRQGDLKSVIGVLCVITLLNVVGTTYYWLRELRSALDHRTGKT